MLRLRVNGENRELPEADPQTPMLWILRDHLAMTGTRYGCGKGLCGSCTIHLDGNPARACITPASAAEGKEITTIEGLGGAVAAALRQAWTEQRVPQCGYCQGGQLMSAEHHLRTNPDAKEGAHQGAMAGNICRCGTYTRIHAAVEQARASLNQEEQS